MKRMYFCIAATGALCASVALAEQLFVNAAYVEMRSDKDSLSEVVAKIPKGKTLNGLGHEGRWIKAETVAPASIVQGYVYDAAISPSQPDTSAFTGSTDITTVDASNAAKGLQPELSKDVRDYSKNKELNGKPLQDLMLLRSKLSVTEWKAFMADGKVGVSNPHQ